MKVYRFIRFFVHLLRWIGIHVKRSVDALYSPHFVLCSIICGLYMWVIHGELTFIVSFLAAVPHLLCHARIWMAVIDVL